MRNLWAFGTIVASGFLFTHIRPVVPTKSHKILQFATILVGGHHTMWWNDILQTENMALKKARMEARRWKEKKRAIQETLQAQEAQERASIWRSVAAPCFQRPSFPKQKFVAAPVKPLWQEMVQKGSADEAASTPYTRFHREIVEMSEQQKLREAWYKTIDRKEQEAIEAKDFELRQLRRQNAAPDLVETDSEDSDSEESVSSKESVSYDSDLDDFAAWSSL